MVQVTPDDIDQALRDNLEHYMDCAGDPDFAEACHIYLMCDDMSIKDTVLVVLHTCIQWHAKACLLHWCVM